MDKLTLRTLSYGTQTYLVILKNINFECDMIEVVCGYRPNLRGKIIENIKAWNIISPFPIGDELVIDTLNSYDLPQVNWYKIDLKLRGQKVLGTYEVIIPPKSKWPKSLISPTEFEIKKRIDDKPMTEHIDEIRFNMKDRLLEVSTQYFKKTGKATVEQLYKAMAANESVAEKEMQEMVDLDFSDDYNDGTLPNTYSGLDRLYYEWFMKDWGLPAPNGKSPKKQFWIGDNIKEAPRGDSHND